ncbi:MAG: UDP-N-acetylglucosamine 2-epimerase (non-hydrolyzing) [Candidatus Heimdallarchaeota archaeon]
MLSIAVIVGTRPEIIKIAPIILEAEVRGVELTLIHTGQHYDSEMSEQIFNSLNLPNPTRNLHLESNIPHMQLAEMIRELGEELNEIKPNIVLAVGDTISVLASCLASVQNKIPFGHVEAGLRSYDNTMPEEINRKIVDSVSSILFAPSQRAVLNLLHEGLEPSRIFFTGNTIVDAIKIFDETTWENKTKQADEILNEVREKFIICTIHRESNVENKDKLTEILSALKKIQNKPLVFLLHPRTAKKIKEHGLEDTLKQIDKLLVYSPIDYLSMMKLMSHENCKLILTDSGGLQEEASIVGKPCVTIRPNTERPETVEHGINFLVETDSDLIVKKINYVLAIESFQTKFESFSNTYGDGFASTKILDIIEEQLENLDYESPELFDHGSKSFFLIEIKANTNKSLIEENFHCQITMVYNERGQPIPIPEELKKGYRIRVTIK